MPNSPRMAARLSGKVKQWGQPFGNWWLSKPGNVRGAIWILLAALFFSIGVVFIKDLGQRIHITQILFVRQMVMLLTVMPILISGFPLILKTNHFHIHMARVFLALIAMLTGFSAVIHIPLAQATAALVGFVGILIMIRPDSDGLNGWAMAAVVGAAAAGMVMIILRYLSRFERPITILSYQAIFIGILVLPPALYYWKTPTAEEWVMLLLVGLTSLLGQWFNIRAFRVGEATAIASLDYTRLLYATLFGAMFFSEWPTTETFIGAGIIIAASLYTVLREAQLGKKLARSAEGRGYNN